VPFDARRSGTVMGEGAAFLVLEAEETAAARGARVLGRIVGCASRFDPEALTGGRDAGTALARAIDTALRDGNIDSVGGVSSSASGSRELDSREAAAIEKTVGTKVPVTAIKSMIGEALGASGAIQAIAAASSLRAGRLPGVAGLGAIDPAIHIDAAAVARPLRAAHALVTALTPEGNCAALVLAAN
jgi:3-oxoacyl-[acyl-carrier-protein] synthase II